MLTCGCLVAAAAFRSLAQGRWGGPVRIRGSSARAIAILAGAAAAAFAVSTAAVSSATTQFSPRVAAVKYPFPTFSFNGGVSTPTPSNPTSFSLTFTSTFTLAANSPGIVNTTTGTLDNVVVKEKVTYPVPAGLSAAQLVGPAALPFSSESLTLTVNVAGSCFVPNGNGGYAFRGSLSTCVTSTLTLGKTNYSVSSLLTSVNGTFTPPPPAGGGGTGSLTASFSNPGYTFPVATLGTGGGTTLQIGLNGGTAATQSVSFTG
jgi:hypothetical protein